jgi:hypothetical protein
VNAQIRPGGRFDYSSGFKVCTRCNESLPLARFGTRDRGTGPRPNPACLACMNARFKAWRANGPSADFLPKPFVPPVDFLPMGEPDRGAVLRWSL